MLSKLRKRCGGDDFLVKINWLSTEERKAYREEGWECSTPFYDEQEAVAYVKYLRELDRDPSVMVSVAGLYSHHDEYTEVIFKYRAL